MPYPHSPNPAKRRAPASYFAIALRSEASPTASASRPIAEPKDAIERTIAQIQASTKARCAEMIRDRDANLRRWSEQARNNIPEVML